MAESRFIHCELRPEPCRSRFAAIIEKSASGVIVMDDEGTVRFANPAAGKLLGCPVRELLGAPGDFLRTEAGLGEIVIDREDGPAVAAEVRMVEAEWGDKTATLAFLRDITDRKSAEDALKAAMARLEEEKGRFEAIVGAIGD
ncbi:MAG TPA: PAS domain S-box protein, partial [Geobacteraceae bacterium]